MSHGPCVGAVQPESVAVLERRHLGQRGLGDDLAGAERPPPTRERRGVRRHGRRWTVGGDKSEGWEEAATLLQRGLRLTVGHGHRLGRDLIRLVDESLCSVYAEDAVA